MKLLSKRTAVRTLITLAVAAACTNVSAATFTVTKVADTNDGLCNSDCSLREAIVAANNLAGADVINVPQGNYVLTLIGANEDLSTTGDLDIRDHLTINGAGRTLTTINANLQERVFHIADKKTVLMTNLAVVNGISYGGGVFNEGSLTANNVRFDGNLGSAIKSRATSYDPSNSLSIDGGLFTNNCGSSGGAIEFVGKLAIKNSVFDGNRPITKGGVECKNGDGAVIHTQYSDKGTIDKSTFINNTGASAGITLVYGDLAITNSTFANNKGIGGIYNGTGGGAVYLQGPSWSGAISVTNSTITNNQSGFGGGIAGVITLTNSIVANNTAPSGPDCSMDWVYSGPPPSGQTTSQRISGGGNIVGSMSGCNMQLLATDFVGSPGLAAIATDAATGQTYFPLLVNSPAIDKAVTASCSTYDQLGKLRPRDGNNDGVAQCDIGAFERQPTQIATVCPSGCAYTSIQAAIDAAAAGATITVGPGTYNQSVTIGFNKKLVSTHGAQSTILDGTGLSSTTVVVNSGDVPVEGGSTINGFTIRNNPSVGVYVTWGGTVSNNIIRDNGSATSFAGGMYVRGLAGFIKNNSFINNKAQSGSAIFSAHGGITVSNNTFLNNQTGGGGTVFINGYSYASSISSNVFKGNIANVGAAVSIGAYGQEMLLANNLIVENTNTGANGAAIDIASYGKAKVVNNTVAANTGGGVVVGASGTLDVINSVVRGNSGYEVSGGWDAKVSNSILGANSNIWAGSSNNSYADPMFVGAGDYRVRAGSPAIDRGKNTASSGVLTDLLGVARPQDGDKLGAGSTGDGSDYDIGAYEFK